MGNASGVQFRHEGFWTSSGHLVENCTLEQFHKHSKPAAKCLNL